jgi:hypothetical protein
MPLEEYCSSPLKTLYDRIIDPFQRSDKPCCDTSIATIDRQTVVDLVPLVPTKIKPARGGLGLEGSLTMTYFDSGRPCGA